ncbi:winged helix-turn-helix domain-containing protein [Dysgonomonas sp. 520]|uniref:winged helix-turn-helix domain-containing protein n=1 Tax=Dysgonomonas sp. 520 TaxID=2302931 RepID=UPI0013D8D461|nr:winged helix-turn-helix domain-containing protein [Dysgonomonas sp. 520]NDW10753.1 hypothetical protein [Dysgonomonas sp. 520]
MKDLIGANAGTVWEYLSEKGEKTVKEIKTATKLTEKDLYAAIGWLAREGKIEIKKIEKELSISLI